ncbi:MAG: NAD(P)/FAD-dependent oxidoreductase [Planctomycetaceae bacterium]
MSRRVVIIGAGAIGLSCAYYAIQRGHRVTVLERSGEHRDGCSYGNAGMVVPSHFVPLAAPGMVALGLRWMANPESPFYIQPRLDRDLLAWAFRFWRASTPRHVSTSAPLLRDLSLMSRQCFIELDQQGLDFDLHRDGLVMLCRTQQGLDHEASAAEQARQLGLAAEVLDADGLRAIEPDVTMTVAGGVRYPQDCHLSPGRFMAAMQSAIRAAGGEFQWHADVLGWRQQMGSLVAVRTSQGDFEADEFVLCGGSWSPQIVRSLALRLPMQAGKGYSLTVDRPRQSPKTCAILTEARIAVTPMAGQLRFGGTMELAGLDESINLRRVRGIVRAVSQYYPEFEPRDLEAIAPWAGLRPCSPDGLPYLGRSARYGNLTIATGHAMMGISLAPISGHLVSQLLDHERPDINLGPFSPDRFD